MTKRNPNPPKPPNYERALAPTPLVSDQTAEITPQSVAENGFADRDAELMQAVIDKKVAALRTGVVGEKTSWGGADGTAKYEACVYALGAAALSIRIKMAHPRPNDIGKFSMSQLPDYGSLTQFVRSKWDGNDAVFEWQIYYAGRPIAYDTVQLAKDPLRVAEYTRKLRELGASPPENGAQAAPALPRLLPPETIDILPQASPQPQPQPQAPQAQAPQPQAPQPSQMQPGQHGSYDPRTDPYRPEYDPRCDVHHPRYDARFDPRYEPPRRYDEPARFREMATYSMPAAPSASLSPEVAQDLREMRNMLHSMIAENKSKGQMIDFLQGELAAVRAGAPAQAQAPAPSRPATMDDMLVRQAQTPAPVPVVVLPTTPVAPAEPPRVKTFEETYHEMFEPIRQGMGFAAGVKSVAQKMGMVPAEEVERIKQNHEMDELKRQIAELREAQSKPAETPAAPQAPPGHNMPTAMPIPGTDANVMIDKDGNVLGIGNFYTWMGNAPMISKMLGTAVDKVKATFEEQKKAEEAKITAQKEALAIKEKEIELAERQRRLSAPQAPQPLSLPAPMPSVPRPSFAPVAPASVAPASVAPASVAPAPVAAAQPMAAPPTSASWPVTSPSWPVVREEVPASPTAPELSAQPEIVALSPSVEPASNPLRGLIEEPPVESFQVEDDDLSNDSGRADDVPLAEDASTA